MGPFVSVVTFMFIKTCPRITDQLTKPGNATVHGLCISIVAISWSNKMEKFLHIILTFGIVKL